MTLRIVCTNDFLSSLAPHATSYGRLPGGRALRQTVERLRAGATTIWADAGDFSQGGPLSTATGGELGFEAAAELGIDVATVGNHEFDWGLEHLLAQRAKLPFPLICANLAIGLEPTALLASDAGAVGFIGLTHPQVSAFTPHAPAVDGRLAEIVPRHADALRGAGAIAVVALIHFGVDWSVAPDGTHEPDPSSVLELCRPFLSHVDAVVLGHTLGRWSGVVDGVPFAQPWAFGAEVGVIELDLDGGEPSVVLVPVDSEPAAWTGTGTGAIELSERTVIGRIATPLTIDFATDVSLADFAAEALRSATGATRAVVPVVGMHQPAIEGVMYRWPAGAVTEADLSRFWPWTDDGCLQAELTPAELEAVAGFSAPEPWLAWGTSTAQPDDHRPTTIAVPRDYVDWATIQIAQIIGPDLEWRPTDVGLRSAIRAALARVRAPASV